MKVYLYRTLFILLAIMPFSPKIEFILGVKIFPQDILLLLITLVFLFSKHDYKFPAYIKPYFFLFIALGIVLLSTIFSLMKFWDMIGLVKTIKYIFYTVLIILVSKYHFNDFVKIFNKIAFFTISSSLTLYLIDLITFQGSIGEFLNASVWFNDLIPTGFYNYVFSIPKMSYYESGGTHGIYGSYLVVVFFINYQLYRQKKSTNLNIVLILFSLLNILILTSRETLLLLVILFTSLVLRDISKLKIKKAYVYGFLVIFLVVAMLLFLNINIGIINKLNHTISSVEKTGTEGNIQARFILWTIIINSILINPLSFFIGTGYNFSNYQDMLRDTANQLGYHLNFSHWETTENFFLLFLIYGGVFAFLISLLFWWGLLRNLFSFIKLSTTHSMFFFLTVGLIITNNTGGSMLSDMFMVQYGLVYIWLNKNASDKSLQEYVD